MHGYRRPAVRIGISGRPLQLSSILVALYSPSVAAVRAEDVADLRDALNDARRELDRATVDLETVRRERDEAMALVRRLRSSNVDSVSRITSTTLSADRLEQIWAEFDDLERRAAATDERIEKRKGEIARVKERSERAERRLFRDC
jgi:hypothetical protein